MRDEGGHRVVRLSGFFREEHVQEVEQLFASSCRRLRVDLTELVSADPAALKTLRTLASRGVELEGISPYLELRLGLGPTGAERKLKDKAMKTGPISKGEKP